MTNKTITLSSRYIPQAIQDTLLPPNAGKDVKHRITSYQQWQSDNAIDWHTPKLSDYRDYLLNERGLSPYSTKAHLATIRGRYNVLLVTDNTRDVLYRLVPQDIDMVSKKSFVDEMITRLQNAVHPSNAHVETITIQDQRDSDHLRLSPDEIMSLIALPSLNNLKGIRDTAIIALMACTGIREAELCNLNVDDLRAQLGGELALIIREGKGAKQRLIPYGVMAWCLDHVDLWLKRTLINEGHVFRGFYKGNKKIRKGRINPSSINRILAQYPTYHHSNLVTVKPHDLRRSYAKNAYLAGMDVERIRQNLGHADLKTTQTYIGVLDADERRPPAIYNPSQALRQNVKDLLDL